MFIKRKKLFLTSLIISGAGALLALIITASLTLFLSIILCIGANPEAVMNAEWIVVVFGIILAGAIVGRTNLSASIGMGITVGILWALTWFYLIGRFNPHIWIAEALPLLSWKYMVAWLLPPILGLLGGLLGSRIKQGKLILLLVSALIIVLLLDMHSSQPSGKYELAKGVDINISKPARDGTITRLFTFDFRKNPNIIPGIYDRDSNDFHPYDDKNTSYYGTPAKTVFNSYIHNPIVVANAGFFTWTKNGHIGSHVAPVVVDGIARYNLLCGPDEWTFGWKYTNGIPKFLLLQGVQFNQLEKRFDSALGNVRPLIVNGKPLELGPGAGVTRLKCSRVSLGWSENDGKLFLLVVRDPDSEIASISKWKNNLKQTGGLDLIQVQNYWKNRGIKNALALDGGDSTQLVYKQHSSITSTGSARLSITLGYLNDKPLRIWLPMFPLCHSDAGVMNYIYIKSSD